MGIFLNKLSYRNVLPFFLKRKFEAGIRNFLILLINNKRGKSCWFKPHLLLRLLKKLSKIFRYKSVAQ